MAKPEIHYISTGSNTLASGCPNAMTAVNATTTGKTAATTGANTTITFSAAVDFTGAAVGDALWFEGNGGNERHLFEISAFNPSVGACTSITTVETTGSAQSGKAFAIGGKRLHGEYNTTRYDVLDGSAGWTFWFEGTSTFDQSVAWVPAAGNTTNGGITIRGDSATTRATLRQTGNVRHIDHASWLKTWYLIFTTNNVTNTATAAWRGFSNSGYAMEIRDCKITGLSIGLYFDTATATIWNCEITSCVVGGIYATASVSLFVSGCHIYSNNTGDTSGRGGISANLTDGSVSNITVVNSVFYNNKRAGINWDGAAKLNVIGCNFYSNIATTGDGILISAIGAARSSFTCLGNIFYGNAGQAITGPTSATVSAILNNGVDCNAYVSGELTNISAGSNDILITGDPFTSGGAGGDYSLDTTANEGAAVKSKGSPLTLPGGATTSNINIGLAQNAYSAGGGSSSFVTQGTHRLQGRHHRRSGEGTEGRHADAESHPHRQWES
jgi:Right handed beta helix region